MTHEQHRQLASFALFLINKSTVTADDQMLQAAVATKAWLSGIAAGKLMVSMPVEDTPEEQPK